MEKNKKAIVPVILQDDQMHHRTVAKPLPQKLVAHEYCTMFEPPVRSFEPVVADKYAIKYEHKGHLK